MFSRVSWRDSRASDILAAWYKLEHGGISSNGRAPRFACGKYRDRYPDSPNLVLYLNQYISAGTCQGYCSHKISLSPALQKNRLVDLFLAIK